MEQADWSRHPIIGGQLAKNVKDKTVLVTGAAMGLGKLFARKAVEQGPRRWCVGHQRAGAAGDR